jgi:hypothetical protein
MHDGPPAYELHNSATALPAAAPPFTCSGFASGLFPGCGFAPDHIKCPFDGRKDSTLLILAGREPWSGQRMTAIRLHHRGAI